MFVCLLSWTFHDCLFVYLDFVMILEVNKWPPGGAGVVLSLKPWNFHQFLMDFDEFLMIFGILYTYTLWHCNSILLWKRVIMQMQKIITEIVHFKNGTGEWGFAIMYSFSFIWLEIDFIVLLEILYRLKWLHIP